MYESSTSSFNEAYKILDHVSALNFVTQARCHSFKNPTPKHTSQNNKNITQLTMARTNNKGNLSPGRGNDDNCPDSDDDHKRSNDDHRGSNDDHGVGDGNRRKSKQHTSSTGTSAKKITKGTQWKGWKAMDAT